MQMPTSHRRTAPKPRMSLRDRRSRFVQRRWPLGPGPRNAQFYFFVVAGPVLFVAGLVDLFLKPVITALEISGIGLAFVAIAWVFFA